MIHPCFKFTGARKTFIIFQHSEKNILNYIFTYFFMPGHMKKEAKQLPVISFIKQAHLINVTVFYFQHKRIIRESIQTFEILIRCNLY